MKDVIVLPVFHRVDYLKDCFESLRNARGSENKELWISQDNIRGCPDLEPVKDLVRSLWWFCRTRFWTREQHYEIGYLNNTHDALQAAYDSGAKRIYYIEDDVVVTPDFFEWHEAVQADGDWMCSSAWRNPLGQTKPHDTEAYYQVQFPTTISIGTCFKREKLKIALKTHDWNPQDRMLNEGWKCVMPYIQRCYHIGKKTCHLGGGECPDHAVDELPDPIPDYDSKKVRLVI